jgi:hypothetical protein
MEWPTGKALADRIKDISGTDKIMLGFSRGKDAIGAAIELKKYFDVVPVFYDGCPGLQFVADSLAYYERALFKRKIHVVPHPNFFRKLQHWAFQDYHGFFVINQIPFPRWTHDDVHKWVIDKEGLPSTTFIATGVRAADSVTRRTAIAKHGPITLSKRTVHFIWDWNKERLISEMQAANVKLPIDYLLWGRTFDGIDARFMIPLKRELPEDFERVKRWFPLVEADMIRYTRLRHEQGQEVI